MRIYNGFKRSLRLLPIITAFVTTISSVGTVIRIHAKQELAKLSYVVKNEKEEKKPEGFIMLSVSIA